MELLRPLAAALALLAVPACDPGYPPLPVVPSLDLERYQGRWYEIASFPQSFQEGCFATTADYGLRDDGRVSVSNRCRDGAPDGPVREAEGVAWVADDAEPAKLVVRFFWPFRGHYWVIALDEDYRYAVVGHPSRDYLWILARKPTLAEETYRSLVERVAALGFDPTRLERTVHGSP